MEHILRCSLCVVKRMELVKRKEQQLAAQVTSPPVVYQEGQFTTLQLSKVTTLSPGALNLALNAGNTLNVW